MRSLNTFRSKFRNFPRIRAFTLQEVLITIGVVALLMSILLPAIAKARLRAIRTVCLNNTKQLGYAAFSYAQDHGKTIPYSAVGGNSEWIDILKNGYGITDETLHCPLCETSNQHSYGGMRKDWRIGGPTPKAKEQSQATSKPKLKMAAFAGATASSRSSSKPAAAHEWARHPNYWKFVAGNFGPKKKATFSVSLVAPGCHEHEGKHNPHPCSSSCPHPHPKGRDCVFGGKKKTVDYRGPYTKKCQGGSQLILVMCENVKPSNFSLEIFNAKNGKRLQNTSGVTIDDCELFEWRGPLAKGLGGEGSLLSPSKPFHKIPVGFDQATYRGREALAGGRHYPNPPSGTGRVNYIFMRTWIRSTVDVRLRVAVSGDEAYSVFMLKGNCCKAGPGSPCEPGKPTTSSYGINSWAQSGHHHATHEPQKFVEYAEELSSGVPLFTEANWSWVMPTPLDLPPSTLDGGRFGIQRVVMDRHDGHVNMVFGDGHAESVPLRQLYEVEWYKKCKLPRGLTIPDLPEE